MVFCIHRTSFTGKCYLTCRVSDNSCPINSYISYTSKQGKGIWDIICCKINLAVDIQAIKLLNAGNVGDRDHDLRMLAVFNKTLIERISYPISQAYLDS